MCPSQGSCDPPSKTPSTSDPDDPYILARITSRVSPACSSREDTDEQASDPLLPPASEPVSSLSNIPHHLASSTHHSSNPRSHADVHNPVYLPSINDQQMHSINTMNQLNLNNLQKHCHPPIVSYRRHSQDLVSLDVSPGLKGAEPPTIPVIHYSTLANGPDEEEYVQVGRCVRYD